MARVIAEFLSHRATYLLKRQLESQAREFTEKGGFSEKLYQERIKARNRQGRRTSKQQAYSDLSDRSDLSE